MKVTMSFYRIFFKPKGQPMSDRQYIGDLTGETPIVYNSLIDFFSTLPVFSAGQKLNSWVNDQKIYHEASMQIKNASQLSGIIQVGDYGFGSEIYDGQGAHALKRVADHVEYKPFYYLIDAPNGAQDIIIGLQNFGVHSVASKFLKLLKAHLKASYEFYTIKSGIIHLGPIFVNEIMANGGVKKIEVTSFRSDADAGSSSGEDIKITDKKIFGAIERGGRLPEKLADIVMSIVKREKRIPELKEALSISSVDDENDKFHAEIVINGKTRKIDLGDIDNFATRYDIDGVGKKPDGHPELAKIDKMSKDILKNDIRDLVKA